MKTVILLALNVSLILGSAHSNAFAQNSDQLIVVNQCIAKKDYGAASNLLNEILKINPNDFEARLAKAEVAHLTGSTDEALNELTIAMNLRPADIRPIACKSAILLKRNDRSEALRYANRALNIDPECVSALKISGICLSCIDGKEQEGIERLTKAIKIEPDDDCYLARGTAYHMLKQNESAINDLLRTKTNKKFRAYLLGSCYQALGNDTEAKKWFDECISLGGKFQDLYRKRGCIETESNPLLALKYLNQAIQQDPTDSVALMNRANINQKLKYQAAANADLDKLISLRNSPEMLELAYTVKGNIAMEEKKYNLALQLFDKALAIEPTDEFTLSLAFQCCNATHNNERAISYFTRYASAKEKSKVSRDEIAIIHYSEKIQEEPKNADLYANKAKAEYNRGLFRKALEDATLATTLNPKSALGFAIKGLSLRKLNASAQAVADISKAVQLNPSMAKFISSQN